jgi:hypothetical protein
MDCTIQYTVLYLYYLQFTGTGVDTPVDTCIVFQSFWSFFEIIIALILKTLQPQKHIKGSKMVMVLLQRRVEWDGLTRLLLHVNFINHLPPGPRRLPKHQWGKDDTVGCRLTKHQERLREIHVYMRLRRWSVLRYQLSISSSPLTASLLHFLYPCIYSTVVS